MSSCEETLAWTLRYKLGLTGTKLGRDRAECKACTVLIDHQAAVRGGYDEGRTILIP